MHIESSAPVWETEMIFPNTVCPETSTLDGRLFFWKQDVQEERSQIGISVADILEQIDLLYSNHLPGWDSF